MLYSCHEIRVATGGALIKGAAEQGFAALSTDTREPQAGKLFIPLVGPRFNGHDFLTAAVKKGATGLLIQEGQEGRLRDIPEDVAVILVPDTLVALGAIAHFWRKKFALPVAAITGSAGKTTTKEMTAQIMGGLKITLKTEGNYNNLVGLPLTILRLREEHEVAILEMGTNVPGEIGRLSRIACPDVGLITNIGPVHLEGLKSLEIIKEEKGDLFRHLSLGGLAVINEDDEAVRQLAGEWPGDRVTYGLTGKHDVTAQEVMSGPGGLSFTLVIRGRRSKVVMATMAAHNVRNALAAAATAWALGAGQEAIGRGLAAFRPVPGRMEILRLGNGAWLINDAYNANPLSVREALDTLCKVKGRHKSVAILGDMLELGSQSEAWHERIGEAAAATGVDSLFLKGAYAPATAAGAQKGGLPASRIHFPFRPEGIGEDLSVLLQAGDWVLVKGSRAMKMEEVIKGITERFGVEDAGPGAG